MIADNHKDFIATGDIILNLNTTLHTVYHRNNDYSLATGQRFQIVLLGYLHQIYSECTASTQYHQ